MGVPEFSVMLKGLWIVVPKKQVDFVGTTMRVVDANPGPEWDSCSQEHGIGFLDGSL